MSEFQNTLQSYRQWRKSNKTCKHSDRVRVWWGTSLIPAPWRLRQGDLCEVETSLGYVVSSEQPGRGPVSAQ